MNFRRTLTAFLGLGFAAYWLISHDFPSERAMTLDPVLPSIIRTTQTLQLKETLTKVRSTAADDILMWLKHKASQIGQTDPNPVATQARLRERALKFSRGDLILLKDRALREGGNADERFLAVYLLGLSESAFALDLLKEIGQVPIPPLRSDRAYSDEFSIRAHALESVVRRSLPKDSVVFLKKILTKTTDPALAKHAQYWLSRLS